MKDIFLQVINMSMTASVAILAVLIIRALLKRTPKIYSYILWSVVLFRLLCPIAVTSPFSVFGLFRTSVVNNGSIRYIPTQVYENTKFPQSAGDLAHTAKAVADRAVKQGVSKEAVMSFFSPHDIGMFLAVGVWMIGMTVFFSYSITTLCKLKKNLRQADFIEHSEKIKADIYTSEAVKTPFVMGILKPRIYLPALLNEEEQEYILLHEQTHIRRKDHIIKLLSFLALCIHWFNPLVWLAFFLSGKDMEMSCDEAVIKQMGERVKKDYSQSLLALATGRHMLAGSPLAFGEGDTKERVKNVLRYKKATSGAVIAGVVLLGISAIVLLSNPKKQKKDLAPSADSQTSQTEQTKENSDLAVKLFEAKNPYAGDHLADGKLLGLVNVSELGEYTVALQTSEEPYGLTCEFTGVWDKEQDDKNVAMAKKAAVLLAMTGNLSQVKWSYLTVDGMRAFWTVTLEDVNGYFENGIKSYSESVEKTEELLEKLDRMDVRTLIRIDDTGYENGDRKENESEHADNAVEEEVTQKQKIEIYVYSLLKNEKAIDDYIAEEKAQALFSEGEPLAFADDCKYYVNRSMNSINYEQVDFDTFADMMSKGNEYVARRCQIEYGSGKIQNIQLVDGYFAKGITFSEKIKDTMYLDEIVGDHLQQFYTLDNIEVVDGLAPGEGIPDNGKETIEVYTGNAGDGASGFVFVKNYKDELIYSEFAHASRAGWNNIYLGRKDNEDFLMTLQIEDRDTYGMYSYQVFKLSDEGDILQIAGSAFTFDDRGEEIGLTYDEDLFRQWMEEMMEYLKCSHLLLSTQDGMVRTNGGSEADKYTFEALKR